MTKPLIQIDDEVREMNDAELAAYQELLIHTAAEEAKEQAKADAKAAVLDRLGITAEEASLLLG